MVFHAFGCHAERFCDLFVRFVFVATHDEDTAGLFREGGQCFVYDLLCLGCKQFFRVAGFEGGDAGVQFPFGMILQVFAGIFPDLYMLQVVDTFVFDDREYIGRNIGSGLQRVPDFPLLHQRFYSEIFGNSYIPHIYIRKADEPSLIICE